MGEVVDMEVVEVGAMEAMVEEEVMEEEEDMVEIMEAVEEEEVEWVGPCHSSRWSRS